MSKHLINKHLTEKLADIKYWIGKMSNFKYIKTDPDVPSPVRMSSGAAGFDLCITESIDFEKEPDGNKKVGTGIAIEMPAGYFGLVVLRSSVADKIQMKEATAIIDSDYRGEVILNLKGEKNCFIPKYSRVAQLVILKCYDGGFFEVDKLSETARGDKGFGSTGL